ncbi:MULTISPECIES: bacteriocin immunity protein [Pseudomonas]|uniref:Bacteriocin immunity protein n=1 Tax=Pseudomonas quercus TaxID=2722792 RepID=A0ABX0YFQ5_9PSED|nr:MULTISPECIES: bacteriocin immunity protein [Pseudomonas]MBF7142549.1 bacteriocin immunity protein [Pseudomonas sp. LY10J]NJP01087.1 bacteriocin immunity protein [Pseudomonas quercus]
MNYLRKELMDSILLIDAYIADESMDEDKLTDAIFRFEELSQHPAGSDLLFWPEPGADSSLEGIVAEVERWRLENGLPGLESE